MILLSRLPRSPDGKIRSDMAIRYVGHDEREAFEKRGWIALYQERAMHHDRYGVGMYLIDCSDPKCGWKLELAA